MANQFGEKIKNLREANNLLQRQVASELKIDTPMLSKIERGERKAKREYIIILAQALNSNIDELLIVWLADQLSDIVKNEELGIDALRLVEKAIKCSKNNK